MALTTITAAVLNSKGGAGKTTTTIYLAAALSQAGLRVEVWDADPQGSATAWLDDAARATETPLPFPHSPVNVASLKRKTTEADVLLIDTPPGISTIQNAVLERADVVIIPTQPSVLDMERAWVTLDALGSDLPGVVLLNQANPRTLTYQDAVAALDAEGVARFEASIPPRQAYKRAYGTVPTTAGALGPWADVAREMQEMMTP